MDETANSIAPMDHRYREPERWQVAMTVQQTTTYQLLRWDQPGDRLAFGTPSNIRRTSAEDFYWVVVPRRGQFAAADERGVIRITPGQAAVLALDRQCRLHIPGSVAYGFQVPHCDDAGGAGASHRFPQRRFGPGIPSMDGVVLVRDH